MSTKKYLSLEEAAALLRVAPEELRRLREKGEVRGFADRGTWKFKGDDIEELARRRQPDSSPDVPIITGDEISEPPSGKTAKYSLHLDEEDELGREETLITKGGPSASDSDVRLLFSEDLRPLAGNSGELPTFDGSSSDSDVRLVGANPPPIKPPLNDSDSDVRIVSPLGLSDSDSDVRLAPKAGSDSDVKLVDRTGSRPASSDSDVSLLPKTGGSRKPGRVSSATDEDTLFGVDSSDSALFDDLPGAVFSGDSGISLTGGSGAGLSSGDSGIRLDLPADSGILLEGPLSKLPLDDGLPDFEDGGYRLAGTVAEEPVAPRRKPADDDDIGATAPMLILDDDDDDLGSRTDPEVPLLFDEDETPPSRGSGSRASGRGPQTSVVLFEDDETEEVTSASSRRIAKGSGSAYNLEGGESGEFPIDEDVQKAGFDPSWYYSKDAEGKDQRRLRRAKTDDDEEDLDAVDFGDDEAGEDFASGTSQYELSTISAATAPQEADWGGVAFGLLSMSLVFMLAAGLVGADLLRTVWGAAGTSTYNGVLLDQLGSLFK